MKIRIVLKSNIGGTFFSKIRDKIIAMPAAIIKGSIAD
jgi:hypothetical protein